MTRPMVYTEERIADYIASGDWDELTVADLWDRNGREIPQKEALVDPFQGKRFTWAQLSQLSDRVALGLIELGIERDSVLVNQLPNCTESVITRIGCDKAGIIHLGPRTTLRHAEMEHILKITQASAVLIPRMYRDFDHFQMIRELQPKLPWLKQVIVFGQPMPQGAISLEQLMGQPPRKKYPADYLKKTRIKANEVGDLSTTTGTTGMPKVAMRPEGIFSHLAKVSIKRYKLSSDDIVLVLAPFWSGINLQYWPSAAWTGYKMVVIERFDPVEAFKAIEKERVTVTVSVPTVYFRMIEHPEIGKYDLSSLRMVFYSGAPMAPELAQKVEEKLKARVVTSYGMVEAGVFGAHDVDDPPETRFNTVGRVWEGMEIKLLDDEGREVPRGGVGEVTARGTCNYDGYYNDPERTWEIFDKEGWVKTGDLGRLDEHGNLYLVGRKKDIIKRGAQAIFPGEIESLLCEHPAVASAAVVAMPDPEMGERACAFVIPAPGKSFTFDEMISFLRGKRIASYKLPERLEIVEQFPLVGEQKVNKRELKEIITRKLKAESKI